MYVIDKAVGSLDPLIAKTMGFGSGMRHMEPKHQELSTAFEKLVHSGKHIQVRVVQPADICRSTRPSLSCDTLELIVNMSFGAYGYAVAFW